MRYTILFEKRALDDVLKLKKSGSRADLKKVESILEDLQIHPRSGTGNPEQLKHQLSGFWSRRINKKDRLIYEIFEEPDKLVVVVSALGHY